MFKYIGSDLSNNEKSDTEPRQLIGISKAKYLETCKFR